MTTRELYIYIIKATRYTAEPQLAPKLLLQMSVRELHNSLRSDPNDGGLKDSRNEDDNIIISDYILRSLFLPKF